MLQHALSRFSLWDGKEITEHSLTALAKRNIELWGIKEEIALYINGKKDKSKRIRLFPTGPLGKVAYYSSLDNRTEVAFFAREILCAFEDPFSLTPLNSPLSTYYSKLYPITSKTLLADFNDIAVSDEVLPKIDEIFELTHKTRASHILLSELYIFIKERKIKHLKTEHLPPFLKESFGYEYSLKQKDAKTFQALNKDRQK